MRKRTTIAEPIESRPSDDGFARNGFDNLLSAAFFALLGLVALYGFVKFAEPSPRVHRPPFLADYSEEPLEARFTGDGLEKRLTEIAAATGASRLTCSPGFYRTESLILEAFRAAGLEVQTQEFPVVVPVTEICEILGENGQPLDDVRIFPFEPSGLMPVALPPEGVSGRLLPTDSLALKELTGHDPARSIVVTTLDAASDWMKLSSLGVPALIVREDELGRSLRADPDAAGPWSRLVTPHEMPFPRFVARGPIEKYAGRPVTIRCKVTWQSRSARNVLGVLRGDGSAREALVVTAYYDSNSVVPDLAPGAEQSVSLAALLECAQAFAPYRGKLPRDVIFVATAGHAQSLAGVSRLMEAVETFRSKNKDYRTFREQREIEEQKLRLAHKGLLFLELLRSTEGRGEDLKNAWLTEGEEFQRWFESAFQTVAGEVNLDCRDEALEARLRYLRAGEPLYRDGFDAGSATDEQRRSAANSHPLLLDYLEAKRKENRSAHVMLLPIHEAVTRPEFTEWGYLERTHRHLEEIVAHHERMIRELNDLDAVRKLFTRYERTLTLNLELYSGGHKRQTDLALLVGIGRPGTTVEPQIGDLTTIFQEKSRGPQGAPSFQVVSWGPRDADGSVERPNPISPKYTELESEVWYRCGKLAFTASNYEFFPPKLCTPEDVRADLNTEALRAQSPVLGRSLLAVANGRVPFKTIAADRLNTIFTLRGTVFGSAGASAILPSHPMGRKTFVHAFNDEWRENPSYHTRGIRLYPVLETNPYGEYERQFTFDMIPWGNPFTVNAARFAPDGRIAFIKDASPAGQSVFKNERVSGADVSATSGQAVKPIQLALFRCAPVTLYDQSNPSTMRLFKSVRYLDKAGLAAPPRYYAGKLTSFFDPDFAFYVGLMDGSAENPEIQVCRAFLLNVDENEPIRADEPELHGRGYLAADSAVLTVPHSDAAGSMWRTAEKRLRLQQRFGMADEQMLGFHRTSRGWLSEARERFAQNDLVRAVNAAGSSLAYAINNHPVIRARISHAVVGILWYLGLLVPFVFFTEKLVFGFTDIRKQLLAVSLIFVVVFGLLNLFHPAFQMVRSSLMILLGFVILLLTVLVMLMVGGKFKQNLKDLRSKEGRVEGADISRGGVIGTAFLLGLNNMRRRKVRTGLTCLTLVLITFVMICFTSVSSDLVNVEYPTGRSPWNGLMIRDASFLNLDEAEVNNLAQLYGEQFPITRHRWLVARLDPQRLMNTELLLDREFEAGGGRITKRARANAALELEWKEPMFSGLDRFLRTERGWFPRPPETRREKLEAIRQGFKDRNSVILPENLARELAISVEDVNQGSPVVMIRGEEYEVRGIIDPVELTKCPGLDGQSLLPYDLNSVQTLGAKAEVGYVLPTDVGRLPGSQVILVNKLPTPTATEQALTVSTAVLFPRSPYRLAPDKPELPAVGYKDQRRLVMEYLERTGESAWYAIDGIAYSGSRTRARTLAGLLELLVPIFLAALTVFNTMRGSVYERKDEIYVYNAVGIAPNHVFFMFMAEALVYAVVGAMLGYLLSQATGRALTALHLTGGMNMDYSSIETIFASLAIVAAVLLSTILPARDAARLAAPSEVRTWTVPKAEQDRMEFNLPFTFTPHDRVAVVRYFHRWFDANGAGSSGHFFCSPPEPLLETSAAEEKSGGLVPGIGCTVWLKPYDLGVSQRVEMVLPTDLETGEYIARVRIRRLSGHSAAWQRTVKPFLGALRKQLLNWRATTRADREEMFGEAKELLSPQITHRNAEERKA